MAFFAIMEATADGRLAKFQEFRNRPEAETHIARHAGRYPRAFIAQSPPGSVDDWRVDLQARRVTHDPRPAAPVRESRQIRAIRRIAQAAGVDVADILGAEPT